MNYRRKVTVIAGCVLVVSLAASCVALRQVDRLRPRATLKEVLFVNSPDLVRRFSLGYNGLMACIYWTRAVQYFGPRYQHENRDFSLLAPLLNITTHLDPHLTIAYEFGASFLSPKPPFGAGEPERAVELMQYGIQNNPKNWRLYYDLGFVYYMDLQDYKDAAETFERGSQIPHAHPFLKILAAQMAQHAGEYQMAQMLWSATYEGTNDKQIKKNAIEHLRALQVDEQVERLQKMVTAFGERTGHLPSSLDELAHASRLPGIPTDPDGEPYELTPEGRVEVHDPDNFPFATKGLPPGYTPKPKFHTED